MAKKINNENNTGYSDNWYSNNTSLEECRLVLNIKKGRKTIKIKNKKI